MNNFKELGLPETLVKNLLHIKFTEPTPIQAKAIPVALNGEDILGSAQTGTGKTAAFGLPIAAKLLSSSKGKALVMTPTRELATQVIKQLHSFLGRKSQINTALLIGGESMPKQLQQLKRKPRLIVGTPGRINDHLKRKSLNLSEADFLVLDETDRMLDMGFTIQIEEIMKFLPEQTQTLLFSATLPKNITRIAENYLNNPVRVSVDKSCSPAVNIKQDNLKINESDKYEKLLTQLDEREGSIIVFVKTKHGTEKMATKLSKGGHKADAIHGDLNQGKRNRVISAFRNKKYRILVATDVAARGLDIPHIKHVINYDMPQCAEDYIHRIGRTARAGAEGSALNLIAPSDKKKWRAIEQLLGTGEAPEEEPKKKSNRSKRFNRRRKGGKPEFKGNNKDNVFAFKKRNKAKPNRQKSTKKVAKATS